MGNGCLFRGRFVTLSDHRARYGRRKQDRIPCPLGPSIRWSIFDPEQSPHYQAKGTSAKLRHVNPGSLSGPLFCQTAIPSGSSPPFASRTATNSRPNLAANSIAPPGQKAGVTLYERGSPFHLSLNIPGEGGRQAPWGQAPLSGISHQNPPSGPAPPSQGRARLPKRVKRPSKDSSTEPIGPCRCLPRMTSALPWHCSMICCQAAIFSSS